MATAGDQINRALRLLGVLAEGETPSASTSSDALTALNQMLDSWSTERLSVYCTTTQTFTWPGATASRTLGPAGDLVGTRPIAIEDSTYYTVNGIDYPLTIVNQEQYNSIAVKTSQSTLPLVLFANPTHPATTLYLYPVPSADISIKIVSVTPLTEPAATSTTLALPPGYLRAFAYNLAMEIAPEFGIDPPAQVKRIAAISKRTIKRINNPGDVMSMPARLVANQRGYNIYLGY